MRKDEKYIRNNIINVPSAEKIAIHYKNMKSSSCCARIVTKGAISSVDRANDYFSVSFFLYVKGIDEPLAQKMITIDISRWRLFFFFAFCPGNLGKCFRLVRFVGDLDRKSLRIMRDQGNSLKTRWQGIFLLIDSFRFWVANFFRFYFCTL